MSSINNEIYSLVLPSVQMFSTSCNEKKMWFSIKMCYCHGGNLEKQPYMVCQPNWLRILVPSPQTE